MILRATIGLFAFWAVLFIIMLMAAHANEPRYCQTWREAASSGSFDTAEWWQGQLARYCHDGETGPATITIAMLEDRIADWRVRCAAEYRTWNPATGRVVRRVSQGRAVVCPLPL